MAELIKMPRLSDTMEEGTVATWFKKVGDKVEEGEILANYLTYDQAVQWGFNQRMIPADSEGNKMTEPIAYGRSVFFIYNYSY